MQRQGPLLTRADELAEMLPEHRGRREQKDTLKHIVSSYGKKAEG